MNDTRSEAEALYRAEGLGLPPVPAGEPLQRTGEHAFATAPVACELYQFDCFVHGWSDAATAPYRAFGFAGHGLNSFAVHYYALGPRVALALQHRWSGTFGDPGEARQRYEGLVKVYGQIERFADELQASGRFPSGRRIAVAHSSFLGSRWAWLAPARAPEWHESGDLAPLEALAELVRLRQGAPLPA